MTLTRKDVAATVLTVLVVLTYTATHETWAVPLVGGSHRWATGAILLLGILGCGQGDARGVGRRTMTLFATLGGLALVLAALAFWTASLTPLSLLVAAIVLLWALATVRHVANTCRGRPVATA